MRVAVIGAGISGISAAVHLDGPCEVTVYEAGPELGGHSNTITAEIDRETLQLDTGFMVYNDRTYPTFARLLDEWGVESQPSNMSFGVSCARTGLEYSGTGPTGLFAQPANLASRPFWRMILDMRRFAKCGLDLIAEDDDSFTIGELARAQRWSRPFMEDYLLPLGSAVWSSSPARFQDFPALALVRFLDNHGLLTLTNRPSWKTVVGGSERYVSAARSTLTGKIHTSTPVRSVRREPDSVAVTADDSTELFDHVVIALHADDALSVIENPTRAEKGVLGAFGYTPNEVVLHHDRSLLPRNRRAWASWNYHKPVHASERVQVTYHLNRLQRIRSDHELCVTLNRTQEIDPGAIIWSGEMSHPQYTRESFQAQSRWTEVSGQDRIHFCGAYWGWGFHEDGAASGERAAHAVLEAGA